eukprot:SAG31_NODE_648_length_13204_cov_57.612908_5_plen_66_part_00
MIDLDRQRAHPSTATQAIQQVVNEIFIEWMIYCESGYKRRACVWPCYGRSVTGAIAQLIFFVYKT